MGNQKIVVSRHNDLYQVILVMCDVHTQLLSHVGQWVLDQPKASLQSIVDTMTATTVNPKVVNRMLVRYYNYEMEGELPISLGNVQWSVYSQVDRFSVYRCLSYYIMYLGGLDQ